MEHRVNPQPPKRETRVQILLISNPHVVPTAKSLPHPPFLLPHPHARVMTEIAVAATRTVVSEVIDPSSSCLVA